MQYVLLLLIALSRGACVTFSFFFFCHFTIQDFVLSHYSLPYRTVLVLSVLFFPYTKKKKTGNCRLVRVSVCVCVLFVS
ncbi:hypothetical protein QBC40DRAFT_291401 [Triangularia verruculosa]|uniref:Uncharacterized protein n=1 Tax=Triangularia verruculosa TaxID=2587418 RepID=A0AAN6X8M3_9PEZI|nr:hypothetical protein QBC40DRAFT_291401 [Triangularia verruculosa]